MAIQNFDKDMRIISALSDEPNDVGGLTATELKEKFDEGGLALQDFINNILLPALNDWEVTGGSGGHVVQNRNGAAMPQRTRLMFLGTVTDDGTSTVVTFTPDDIGAARAVHKHSTADITTGTMPIAYGGTGAATAADARRSLGVPTITYGTDAPSGGKDGDIYFQIL
jgi:hypothetical protein